MTRREALQLATSTLGVTLVGAPFFLNGCKPVAESSGVINDSDIALLDEIAEVILPASDLSPGAKTAQVGTFIQDIVNNCYSEDQQKIMVNGKIEFEKNVKEKFKKNFFEISPEQRHQHILGLDKQSNSDVDNNPTFYTLMKQLTIWGYFSSEAGATKALRYNPIPGRFEGCVPYHPGDKAWA